MSQEFDAAEYERAQSDRLRAVGRKLLDVVVMDYQGNGPPIEFTCPQGHSLKTWRVMQDGNGDVHLAPLAEEARRSGPVAANGSPWQRSSGVCPALRCPNLVRGDRYCDQHGGGALEVIHGVRTRFTCRLLSCGWSDAITTVRLMQLYTVAAVSGEGRISLSGGGVARRRKGINGVR